MKYLLSIMMIVLLISSCKDNTKSIHENRNTEANRNLDERKADLNSKFPTIGFKKIHEEIIPFPVEEVFPLFEPNGRYLLYDNWEPTVLKKGENGSLIGQIEFSKYDHLDVILKITEHNPEKGHIQYLAVWDDFEIQRIDIFCERGIEENTTNLKWIEHNAGLYEKGVSLVSKFVEEGYLVQAVERYTNNIEMHLSKEQRE